MATAYIWNAFGKYETHDGNEGGIPGITLRHGGVPFFLPYEKVTAIPNWTFREVDHEKSCPPAGQEGILTYREVNVTGDRVASELTMGQIPIPYHDMGITVIQGKATGRGITVPAGTDMYGAPIEVEVMEREPTREERRTAEELADKYKRDNITDYFQGKRERMAGGQGKLRPDKMTRIFMEELNVQDIDDSTTHQKEVGGMDVNLLKAALEMVREASEVNGAKLREAVETVRKAGKVQMTERKTSRLAEFKAKRDAEIAAEEAAKAQAEVPVEG